MPRHHSAAGHTAFSNAGAQQALADILGALGAARTCSSLRMLSCTVIIRLSSSRTSDRLCRGHTSQLESQPASVQHWRDVFQNPTGMHSFAAL